MLRHHLRDGSMSHPTNESVEESEESAELVLEEVLVPDEAFELGRYELVLELGTGGMASVHLARTRGPAGFHKWFAVKRIHPHLAKDPRFVSMFLDEARIAASIEHPNVAQVVELGEDEGTFFIAMEYLHGEHLGRVASRAVRDDGHIRYHRAGWLIAEAAKGLHAAHEGLDPEGRPLELVHRDVSPQNIFVTYDGRVKLTDFGVAKAANRISETVTGTAKGKVAYMSPEQALGGPLDRRTDVFALGAVLWEITTGRRLFKAGTDAQTLMRITGGKVPKPSSRRHDYPPALERIVLRALARRAEDRFPSAGAMALELERFVNSAPEPVSQRNVAEMMGRLFGDAKSARDQVLRVTAGRPSLAPSPELSVDDLPAMSSESGAAPSSSVVRTIRAAPKGRVITALVVLMIGATAGVLVALSSDEETDAVPMVRPAPTASASGSAPPATPASDSIPSEPLRPSSLPDGTPEEVPLSNASGSEEAASMEPPHRATEPARVTITSVPAGASVRIDGEVLGVTPLESQEIGGGPHDLVLVKPGYQTVRRRIDAITGSTVERHHRLEPLPARATLSVTAIPYAEVTIGGRTQTTPATFHVRPGTVRLRYRLRGEGPARTKTLEMGPGERDDLFLSDR
jgi:serine/threonine protein kinase